MVSIVSDSSTLYSVSEGKNKDLYIVPLNITINKDSYRDFEDISSTQLLKRIENHEIPRTSQPSLGEKVELYNKLGKDGEVIDITMASGLSGTYDTALMAKENCDYSERVHVIDSMTLCGPHRLIVDTALDMAKKESSAKNIVKMIVQSRIHEMSYLIPVDFQYLVRGGRIRGVAATLGGALKLIPILKKGKDGCGLDKLSVARTHKKVIDIIINDLIKCGADSDYTFFISHAFNEELSLRFEQQIKTTFENVKVVIYPLSPSFITQGGPGCVAIQAIKIER